MENPLRKKTRGLPNTRCLRFEPLESRLQCAVDSMLVDTDLWLMPVSEPSWLATESWMFRQESSDENIEEMEAFEASLFDFVLRTPELFDPAIVFSEGEESWMLSPVVPADIASSIDGEFLPSYAEFITADFELDPLGDSQLLGDLLTPSDTLPADLLPFGWSELIGYAIPLGEFGLAYFVEDDVIAIGTTTSDGSNFGDNDVAPERPHLDGSDLFFVNTASMKVDSNLLVGNASSNPAQLKELLTNQIQFNQEGRWQQKGKNDAFGPETLGVFDRIQLQEEHYKTFSEMLRHNAIEIEPDSQLTIEHEQAKTTRGARSEENVVESRIEIAQVNARLPVSTLPEGMLPIGGEGWIDAYPRGLPLRLSEDFVVQTALICDDLQAVAIPSDAPGEHSSEEIPSYKTPERFYWVAIGGTFIVTHTSLIARRLREASIVKWLLVKLPKFTKHDPNKSL